MKTGDAKKTANPTQPCCTVQYAAIYSRPPLRYTSKAMYINNVTQLIIHVQAYTYLDPYQKENSLLGNDISTLLSSAFVIVSRQEVDQNIDISHGLRNNTCIITLYNYIIPNLHQILFPHVTFSKHRRLLAELVSNLDVMSKLPYMV